MKLTSVSGSRDWRRQRKSALQQIQLQAKLLDSALTPNSALLKFAGSANMTIDQVLRRRSELLTTFGLNVISVRPEPGAVVVTVERPEREVVNIQELWSRWRPGTAEWGNQNILIGIRENDGSQLFLSPGRKHAPHTLIAGSTGSGKSVLMQNIILGIAATNTPEQARILLIDPKKGVDYFAFEDLPHLDGGIIDNQETASRRLSELVAEMDRRYVRFKEVRVPTLAAYNAKVVLDQRLPAIWLIHDEFAEWMLVEDYKESVTSVVRGWASRPVPRASTLCSPRKDRTHWSCQCSFARTWGTASSFGSTPKERPKSPWATKAPNACSGRATCWPNWRANGNSASPRCHSSILLLPMPSSEFVVWLCPRTW